VAVVQYTFTHKQYTEQHNRHKQYIEQHNRHKQYIEQHNRHKQYIEQHNSLIRKSADRAPSLRGIPWHLPYNWRKSTESPKSGLYSFFNLGARWGRWSTPRPGRFTRRKDPVPTVLEAGWAPGLVWTGAENLAVTGSRSPDRPARSQLLYRLSYPGPYFLCWMP